MIGPAIYGVFAARNILMMVLGIVALLAICFFILMVGFLIMVHTFLAMNNMTTWESLSWKKISYTKIWPKKYGSPFFKSYGDSLKLYFNNGNRPEQYIHWEMPRSLPSFEEGARMSQTNCVTGLMRRFL